MVIKEVRIEGIVRSYTSKEILFENTGVESSRVSPGGGSGWEFWEGWTSGTRRVNRHRKL